LRIYLKISSTTNRPGCPVGSLSDPVIRTALLSSSTHRSRRAPSSRISLSVKRGRNVSRGPVNIPGDLIYPRLKID
jgi:hypothetical protein